MEDYNREMMTMTVRCILCRGMILYKDGDITRFSAHLANEHGAFFDVEYLLASCFMTEDHKAAIANPIRAQQEQFQTQQQTYQPQTQGQAEEPLLPLADQTHEDDKTEEEVIETSRHACDKCGKSYTRKEGLKRHILKAHSVAPANDNEATVEEMETLIEDINKELEGLEQDQDSSMDSSMDTSTEEKPAGDRPFKCIKCPKSYAKKDILRSHMKQHADVEAGVEYKCDKCDKTYTTKAGIFQHKKTKHTGGDEEFKLEQQSNEVEEEQFESTEKKGKGRKEGTTTDKIKEFHESLLNNGIDLEKSIYFKGKNKVLFNGAQQASTFTEISPYLPEGWKMKAVEHKEGSKVVINKHYLSPAHALIKSTLGVVEYLRLEGKLSPDALLDTARALKVGPKKLKKLYSNDPSDNDETVAEA